MRHLSSREIRMYVASILSAYRPQLQERINLVDGSEAELVDFLHYFRREVVNQNMITTMIEQLGEDVTYQAVFPTFSTTKYMFNIWCVGQIENDQHRDDVFSELATGIKDIVNGRHVATEIEGGKWLYFKDPPIVNVRFGAPNFGTVKTGGCTLLFSGKCDIVDEDPRKGATGTFWVP